MIVYIVIVVAIAYVVGWVAWRLVSARTPKKTRTEGSWVARMFGRLFGGGWVYPAAAVALAAILFFFRADFRPVIHWSEPERAELDHFTAALSYYDDASRLYSNKARLSYEDWESVNAMLEAALAEGEQVHTELLRKLNPELPQKYQDQFLAGLRTGTYGLRYFTISPKKSVDTLEHHGNDSLEVGRQLLGEWNTWFNENREEILDRVD